MRKKEVALSVRSRAWSLVLYDDPALSFTDFLNSCLYYVYIFHDKDLKKDGSPKEPHYHLLCVLSNAKTLSAILQYHTTDTNVLGEPIEFKYKAYRYLRHLGQPDKYQYPFDSLISNNIEYWEKLDPNFVSTSGGEKTLAMLEDILAHKPLRDMVLLYGRDYVKNYYTYRDFAIQMKTDDTNRNLPKKNIDPVEVCLFELEQLKRENGGDLPF